MTTLLFEIVLNRVVNRSGMTMTMTRLSIENGSSNGYRMRRQGEGVEYYGAAVRDKRDRVLSGLWCAKQGII